LKGGRFLLAGRIALAANGRIPLFSRSLRLKTFRVMSGV